MEIRTIRFAMVAILFLSQAACSSMKLIGMKDPKPENKKFSRVLVRYLDAGDWLERRLVEEAMTRNLTIDAEVYAVSERELLPEARYASDEEVAKWIEQHKFDAVLVLRKSGPRAVEGAPGSASNPEQTLYTLGLSPAGSEQLTFAGVLAARSALSERDAAEMANKISDSLVEQNVFTGNRKEAEREAARRKQEQSSR